MLEFEVKYPLPDDSNVMACLQRWGARAKEDRRDSDHYFNSPDRDFARTDEALRVRRIGQRNLLTYKGPKIDAETKTRQEIEVEFAGGDESARDLLALLTKLSYRPVAIVRKHRRIFEFERDGFTLQVCLDDVDRVGRFAEIEIVGEESELEKAKAVLAAVASDFGLNASERRSYLELLLKATASK
jgi:adenylate cyclase class 2